MSLEEVRKRLHFMNIKAFAEAAGVKRDAVYRLMHPDARPTAEVLDKVRAALVLHAAGELEAVRNG